MKERGHRSTVTHAIPPPILSISMLCSISLLPANSERLKEDTGLIKQKGEENLDYSTGGKQVALMDYYNADIAPLRRITS